MKNMGIGGEVCSRARCGLLGWVVALGLALGVPVGAHEVDPVFAEPYTGRKVQAYEVDVPVGPGAVRRFHVPGDCTTFLGYYRARRGTWGSRVQVFVTRKVASDCELYEFLAAGDSKPAHDYVSHYDFRNAALADLPFDLHCAVVQAMDVFELCQRMRSERPDVGFLDFPFPRPPEYRDRDLTACRFVNGVFRGHVVVQDGILRCERHGHGHGFRVLSVDFADVDRDGYMDAVLRISELGSHSAVRGARLVLTRRAPDGPFSAVFLPRGSPVPPSPPVPPAGPPPPPPMDEEPLAGAPAGEAPAQPSEP